MTKGPAPAVRGVLLLGGTSEIGLATLHALRLGAGSTVVLAGRDTERLTAIAHTFSDGVQVIVETFDALDPDSVAAVVGRAFDAARIDVVLPAFGVLGDQQKFDLDPSLTADLLTVNVVAQTRALLESALRLREQGQGVIVVLSSVAAVRPRRANFVYGATKAALDAVGQGLSDSLHGSGVRVLVVRPGFVIGRMTAGMHPAPMSTTPDVVGAAVAAAIADGRSTIWVPARLRWLALAMRLAPRPMWRRLRR